MTRIAINATYGGFGLGKTTQAKYDSMCKVFELIGPLNESPDPNSWAWRAYPHLVWAIETTQKDILYSSLKIVEIPDDVKWVIQDYDGDEWVAEQHRTWS